MADNKTNGQNNTGANAKKDELSVNEKALIRMAVVQITDEYKNPLGTKKRDLNPTWNDFTSALVNKGLGDEERGKLYNINKDTTKLNRLNDEALKYLKNFVDITKVKLDDKEGVLIGIAKIFEDWFKANFVGHKRQKFKHTTISVLDVADYMFNKNKTFPKDFVNDVRGDIRSEKMSDLTLNALKAVYDEMVA